MKKSVWGMIVMGFVLVGLGLGAVEKSWTLSDWVKDLDVKLRRFQDRQKMKKVAVAAVRGSAAKRDDKMYWKGEKAPTSEEEVTAFRSALETAQAGDKTAALAALDGFLTAYPQSAFKKDVIKTRELLLGSTSPVVPAETPAVP